MSTYEKLSSYAKAGKSIRIGSTGAGWMGGGFVAALRHVPGMRLDVLSDPDIKQARSALLDFGGVAAGDIVETNSVDRAEDAIRSGKRVVTTDSSLASRLPTIDIVTDVTPSPASGARTAVAAIENGKSVVLINIETDVTVGAALKKRARQAGVFYSVSSGDEPGCLMELWDFVSSLGYTPHRHRKGQEQSAQRRCDSADRRRFGKEIQ